MPLLLALLLSQASPTVIVDPTVQSKRAPVTNSAPASNAYGLNVRVVSQPAGGAAVTATQGPAADGGAAWSTLSQVWDGTDTAGVSAGGSLQVTCDNCGGSTFEDNDAFTPGTSSVSNAGLEVDDTGTTAVTENSAGAQRMTTFRSAHTVLRDSAGNERGANVTAGNALVVDGSASTQPVSGTVTANVGTFPDNEPVAQGTAASSANRWKVQLTDGTDDNLVSAAGALVVDGSGVTQPVSGTVTVGTFPDNEPVAQGTAASSANRWKVQLTDGTDDNLVSAAGALLVDASATTQPISGTVTVGTFPDNEPINVAQMNGTAVTMGNGASGTGVQRVTIASDSTGQVAVASFPDNEPINVAQLAGTATAVNNGTASAGTLRVTVASDSTGTTIATQATAANLNVRPDTSGATAAAPPARADFVGGLGSGATGGFLTGITVCDSHVAVDIVTATTTLIVTGVSGRHVRICALDLVTAGANNVAIIAGTGATCGTSTAGMNGGVTAAEGWNFAANGGISQGSGFGEIMRTETTGDSVCIITSAAVQLSGNLAYAIY